jgi:putative transposase
VLIPSDDDAPSGGYASSSKADHDHPREVREVHERDYCAYGYRRMSIALKREGKEVGKSRVQRLMREAEIQGAKRRGKP